MPRTTPHILTLTPILEMRSPSHPRPAPELCEHAHCQRPTTYQLLTLEPTNVPARPRRIDVYFCDQHTALFLTQVAAQICQPGP